MSVETPTLGDMVFWYPDPLNPSDPSLGWIIEPPGMTCVSILVFSQSQGFVEKKSVRHADDPFWRESELAANWQAWGCWRHHPNQKLLNELRSLITTLKIGSARETCAEVKRGPGRPRKVVEVPQEAAT